MSPLLRALATDARVGHDDHDDLARTLNDLLAYEHWWRAFDERQAKDEFRESDHPRDEGGKFGLSKGGGKPQHGPTPQKGTILAAFTDPEGYSIRITGGTAPGHETAMGVRRHGTMRIFHPNGSSVRGGYFMGFPEKEWGLSDKAWRGMSWQDKAAKQVEHQATAYKPLKEQFAWHSERQASDAEFKEGDHPRDQAGKFGSGGGGKTSPQTPQQNAGGSAIADKLKGAGLQHTRVKTGKDGNTWVLASTALNRLGNPVTLPGETGSAGVAVKLNPQTKTASFYEINNGTGQKGLGAKMVEAVIGALPEGYKAAVHVDLSQGFWPKIVQRYPDKFGEDEFKEADHPRDNDGKFGSGGGGREIKPSAPKGSPQYDPEQSRRADGSKPTYSQTPRLLPLKPGAKPPAHIAALKIPPAWTDVHYAENPGAHLLVVGRDTKGRPVSIYAPSHHARQAAAKYAKVTELAQKFDAMVAQNEAAKKDPEKRDAADALDLVMKMGVRPGSDRDTGAEQQAYGATTLEGRHVRVSSTGNVRLNFTGKKGVANNLPVTDKKLATMLAKRKEKAGANGRVFGSLTAGALRQHAHDMDGGGFTTKDFRTHLGTKTASQEVASRSAPQNPTQYKRAVREVAKTVAERLGNTPSVALASYISPTVFAAWRASAGV